MTIGGSGPQFGERAEFGPGDVCYRHPNAQSFTLCQRCGHTICGDCQVVSSVGVLCPDCMKQTQPAASQRAKRTARAFTRTAVAPGVPVVNYTIMAMCVLVFVAQLLGNWFAGDEVTRALWYAPLYSLPQVFEPWRMITVMFTHSTGFLLHILFNLYALWLFGRNLELMLGRVGFMMLYLYSGIGGSLGVMLWTYVDPVSMLTPTVGASGAIFGVLGATLIALRAARVNFTSLAVLIAINFGIGFLPGTSISWQAHLGGMIVGAAVMWLLLETRGPRKAAARIWVYVCVGAVLAFGAALFWVVLPAGITG